MTSAMAAGQAEEPLSLPEEITLADALRATAARNPTLEARLYDLHAAEGRREQAGLRPNPELDLELENFSGSGTLSGTDALETTLTLSQLIELGGKRDSRLGVAGAEIDLIAVEQSLHRLDAFAEVTRRFIRLVADQDQLKLARSAEELAQQFSDGVTARVKAARSPVAEQSRAGIALARARLETARAGRSLETSRRSLAAMWGSAEPGFAVARADLRTRPAVVAYELLVERLESNPAIARYLSEERLREAELSLARANRRGDLTVAGGLRRLEESGDVAAVLSLTVPLPVANRNQGAIREAQARLDQVSRERAAVFSATRAELFGLYQSLEQARLEADALETELIPGAQTALAETQYGFERGRFSYLEVAEARRELAELQRARVEADAGFHLVLTEIERLTGESLSGQAP